MDENNRTKKSIIKRIFADNAYCWLAVGCTTAIMMLVYFCFNLWPFGEVTILRMDLYHQYGPLFAELYDRITNFESLIYSWRTGLGSPFLGNYFNYLSSPAALIILLLGHKNMPESIAGMILLKAALSAGAFTLYLRKSRDRHDFTTAAFGVLYAMCGYFVAYYWNVMWIDAMVYFPLVVYGIEKIINKRRPGVYIAFLALTLLSNYYMGYMTCVFSVIYFIVYYISNYDITTLADNTVYYLDYSGEKQYKLSEKLKGSVLLRSGFTFALGSLAAACVAAFSLLPLYSILTQCSATSGNWPQNYRVYFSVFDFLANHLASVDPTIRSSGEDVLPNVYCGMATLVLVPLYIFSRRISLKEKIASIFTLGLIYFSFNINFLNYVWHGFHFPNDLPYRFSFMYCFLLLTLAFRAFTNLSEYNGRQILASGVAVTFMIILVQEIGSKNVQDITVLLSVIFVVTYCLLLYLLKDENKQKSAIAVILLCAVIAEIACSNTDRYSMSQTKTNYASDYDEFRELKSELDKKESGDDKYRMELTFNRARMDPAWYGFNGVSMFSSMAYEKMANMQSNLGVYGNYINSYTYYLQTPVYNMMNALKYVVDNDDNVEVETDYFDYVAEKGKFTAYENKYYLPIAFTVKKDIKDWYSQYTNPFLTQGEWFRDATGVDDVFEQMTISDIRYFNINEITSGLETGDIFFTKQSSGAADMTFVITPVNEGHCYLFVDSNNFEEITLYWEDERSVVQSTDEPYIYDLGILSPGETVEVLITPDENSDNCNMNFYAYSVNDEALQKGYEILKKGQLNVDVFDDTYIKGTVTAGKKEIMFTSIPFDKGWNVRVDGKPIDAKQYINLEEAYLCFEIPEGEHTVEFRFTQRGLIPGACISAATLLLLIAFAILAGATRDSRKKKYEDRCRAAEEQYLIEKQQRDTENERMKMIAQMQEESLLAVDMELFDSLTQAGEPEAQADAAQESAAHDEAPEGEQQDAQPSDESVGSEDPAADTEDDSGSVQDENGGKAEETEEKEEEPDAQATQEPAAEQIEESEQD